MTKPTETKRPEDVTDPDERRILAAVAKELAWLRGAGGIASLELKDVDGLVGFSKARVAAVVRKWDGLVIGRGRYVLRYTRGSYTRSGSGAFGHAGTGRSYGAEPATIDLEEVR